jgi:hypothetical protein
MRTKLTPEVLSDPSSLFEHIGSKNAPRDTVKLPNGQTFLVRGLTSQEYGTVQAEMRDDGDVDWQASAPLYLVFGALKPDGKQAFEMSDIGKIMNTPRALIQPMLDMILDLTGVSNDANKRLAKNWSKMTAVASSLGSQASGASQSGK